MTWKRLLFITILVMACALPIGWLALKMWVNTQPKFPAPGEIFGDYGEYRSPNREFTLIVEPTENPDWNTVKFLSETSNHTYRFDSRKTWFASYDKHGRLWFYMGDVLVFGKVRSNGKFRFHQVQGRWGWEGVPLTFLEKLPEQHRADYETWAKSQGLLPQE